MTPTEQFIDNIETHLARVLDTFTFVENNEFSRRSIHGAVSTMLNEYTPHISRISIVCDDSNNYDGGEMRLEIYFHMKHLTGTYRIVRFMAPTVNHLSQAAQQELLEVSITDYPSTVTQLVEYLQKVGVSVLDADLPMEVNRNILECYLESLMQERAMVDYCIDVNGDTINVVVKPNIAAEFIHVPILFEREDAGINFDRAMKGV